MSTFVYVVVSRDDGWESTLGVFSSMRKAEALRKTLPDRYDNDSYYGPHIDKYELNGTGYWCNVDSTEP